MNAPLTRRDFLKTLTAGAVGLAAERVFSSEPVRNDPFSFVLFGDLHFDRLKHHDLEWLQREKPDDLRQVREYSRLTAEILPRLFASVRESIAGQTLPAEPLVAFAAQVGDLVEGLCGNESLAAQQNSEAVEFLRKARLGVPFLFTKGNHDVTGPGATEAFKSVFQPFLAEEAAPFKAPRAMTAARFTIEHRETLFCFYDAYDKESLDWLEAALQRRTAQHCFLVVHPPVVPYGARSTWHVFARERDKLQRERLLELLGKHNVFVLSGHIHKYNVLVRSTPKGGKFLQVALSSVVSGQQIQARNVLSGTEHYTPDQVKVEPNFSPSNETERRAVYEIERASVKHFQYADLPGYALVKVNGPKVTLGMFSGVTRELWRTLDLTGLLAG